MSSCEKYRYPRNMQAAPKDTVGSNSVLYHYTSAAGLLGIIRNRRIWATESNFLNDPSEIAFAADATLTGLSDAAARHPEGSPVRAEIERASSWIAQKYLDPHTRSQYHEDRSFISSFSYSDDVLTLWRSYAGANGFCVGFDVTQLLSWCRDEFPELHDQHSTPEQEEAEGVHANFGLTPTIEDVGYGQYAANIVAQRVAELVCQPDFSLDRDEYLLRDILRSLATVKHPAYEDEREARLVVHRTGDLSPNPSVRVSPVIGLVAYHEIAFPHDAVVSITAAPGTSQQRSENAVRSLLRDGGRGAWSHVDVRSTAIPFGW